MFVKYGNLQANNITNLRNCQEWAYFAVAFSTEMMDNKCRKDGCTLKFANQTFGYTSNINEVSSEDFIEASFPFNSSLSNEHICFIDTPGINNANDLNHQEITKEIVAKDEYDVVIYISNSLYFVKPLIS